MSTDTPLLELRIKLDEAITYGSRRAALSLARRGVRDAQERDLQGEAEYFKGQVDLLQSRFTRAIEHFDAAIRHNPADGASYNDRALCMVELGIIDDSLAYFDKGIEVEPDYATVYHNKGWLLNNIGRHTEAIACFRKALSLEPRRAVTYDNLADALWNCGDFAGARQAYIKVIAFLPPRRCMEIRKEIMHKIKQIEGELKK
ncbi:MAG: tetratricopeptide repeat protein [Candidatus Omnitrophica bacterium]|nr:tetratricopeptide repeat protein [Candidatus Omnitrophota bacterium]